MTQLTNFDSFSFETALEPLFYERPSTEAGYLSEDEGYSESGISQLEVQERLVSQMRESSTPPVLEGRITTAMDAEESGMPVPLERVFRVAAVFDPQTESFPALPTPHALIPAQVQGKMPQADQALFSLENLTDARAIQSITDAIARAKDTKEAQFLKASDYGIPRSVLVTGSGDIYVLFNKKKQGDLLLGKGHFKNVYAALNLKTGSVAAFLSTKKNLHEDPNQNKREFDLSSNLTGSTIHSSFVDRGAKTAWLAIAMDGSLEKGCCTRQIDMSTENKRFNLALQMLDELATIHQLGIVHMDIKPSNILYHIDPDKNCYLFLSDWGLSIERNSLQKIRFGAARYLSPESVYTYSYNASPFTRDALPTDYATPEHDSWAMGLTLFSVFASSLDRDFITNSPKVVRRLVEEENRIHSLNFEDWYFNPLTQDEWMPEPRNKEGMEFVIWNLLQIDPAKRWTPKQAADYLRSLQSDITSLPTTDEESSGSPMSASSPSCSSSPSSSERSISPIFHGSSSSSDVRSASPMFL
ncbi:MAG: hypothetical protein JSR39_04290 [Verrucomicrobia bacterium]|nr:hypothetical protein [Verrucomicrobiota bacterium]